jgi:hypothetical protein
MVVTITRRGDRLVGFFTQFRANRLFYCRIEQFEQISDCQSRLQSGAQGR